MTDYLVCQIPVPPANDIPLSWVAEQTDDIFRAESLATLGSLDFFTPVRDRVPGYRDQADAFVVALVAVRGVDGAALPPGEHGMPLLSWDAGEAPAPGEVLATASVGGALRDNTHLAWIGVVVGEPHRGGGVGRALYEACERLAVAAGRRTIQAWAEHLRPTDEADALVPPTGVGAVSAADPTTCFALAMGFELEQCERHSVCPLPLDKAAARRLWDEALPHAEGYELRTLQGAIPDELAERYCAMLRHFTTEMPSAGLDLEEEQWDVERLRRAEARRVATGQDTVTTLAIHTATGDICATTDLTTDANNPEVGFQQVTVVDSGHRGHRLGTLVKIANARAFHDAHPQVLRLHTWNAGENQWMLAINDAMGFTEGIVEGAWQKRTPA